MPVVADYMLFEYYYLTNMGLEPVVAEFEVVDFVQKKLKNRAFCVVFALLAATIFNILGFEKIVSIIYPVLGAVAFVVFTAIAIALWRKKRNCAK